MTRSQLTSLVLALSTVGGIVLAWRQYGELVELRASALNGAERAEWQERVRQLESINREQREQLAAARGPGPKEKAPEMRRPTREGAAPATAAARSEPAREGAGNVRQQTAAIRALLAKPEVQALLGAQKNAAIEQRYADLFRLLNLPPEQVAKLKALLVERSSTMQDIAAAAREQGINLRTNPEAYKQLVTETQNQLNAGIKAAIGESGFAQLTTYDRTVPQRILVNDLEQRLSYTGNPLSPAQAEQLVQILAANPAPRPMAAVAPGDAAKRADAGAIVRNAMTTVPGVGQLLGAADDSGRSALPLYPISPAALGQAQTVLSPGQLAALQQLQQQQQAQAQLKVLVTETLMATQPPAPAPAPERKPGG